MTDRTRESSTFDEAKYRQVLGQFPTGVTVITADDGGVPVGTAIGSFTSLSLDPPQVLFCIGQVSSSWPRLRAAGRFCVNILSEDQEGVCRVFATKAADKFAEIGWSRSGNGSPLIDGALGFIDCTIADVITSGDHDIVVGDVTDLDVLHQGGPLVFFRGGYGRFQV